MITANRLWSTQSRISERVIHIRFASRDTSDDFTSDKLGMQWQWNANPQKDWYELTGSKLKLNALDTVPLRPVSDYRNLLLQKWPAPEFTCVTKAAFRHGKRRCGRRCITGNGIRRAGG